MEAFADAMLIIPKTLALNAGFDAQESIVKLQETAQDTGEVVGIDLNTGEACMPTDEGKCCRFHLLFFFWGFWLLSLEV